MGPVAQLVFKTSAVVQPTARSVRLRRRSVGAAVRRSAVRPLQRAPRLAAGLRRGRRQRRSLGSRWRREHSRLSLSRRRLSAASTTSSPRLPSARAFPGSSTGRSSPAWASSNPGRRRAAVLSELRKTVKLGVVTICSVAARPPGSGAGRRPLRRRCHRRGGRRLQASCRSPTCSRSRRWSSTPTRTLFVAGSPDYIAGAKRSRHARVLAQPASPGARRPHRQRLARPATRAGSGPGGALELGEQLFELVAAVVLAPLTKNVGVPLTPLRTPLMKSSRTRSAWTCAASSRSNRSTSRPSSSAYPCRSRSVSRCWCS